MTQRGSGGGATYVLIPGAGGQAWYWQRLVKELVGRGRVALTVELPAADESAGLAEYTEAVLAVIGDRSPLVLVAQSMGAFTAPLVCDRVRVDLMVLVNAMIPAPGETAGDWWTKSGYADAVAAAGDRGADDGPDGDADLGDLPEVFFHDVPADIRAEAIAMGEPRQADKPFGEPWPLAAWPQVTTRALAGRDDRLFPLEFQRRLAKERLGLTLDEMPGGHLVALSQPQELAERLEAYRTEAELA